jgi:hypothetical protein
MPRKLSIRPPRPSPSSIPPSLQGKRSLIRRPRHNIEFTAQKKLPPKIVALDTVPRIPLTANPNDQARRLARIEQIKQLYTPREFKRLRDQQMQLALPDSPLKSTKGRFRLGILFWIYFSMMVFSIIYVTNNRSRLCSFQNTCIRRNSPKEYNGIFGKIGGIGCLEGYYMIRRMMIWIQLLLPSHWTRTDAYEE